MTFLIIAMLTGGFVGGRVYESLKINRELKVDKSRILKRLSETELRTELSARNSGLLLLDINTGKEEKL